MHPPPATAPASGRRWRVAGHTRESCATVAANTLCTLLLVVLLVAGVLLFVAWLGLRPHRPRFSIQSFAVVIAEEAAAAAAYADQVAFNVSDINPNRHAGIRYGATRAAVYYVDALIAGGKAISGGWYQPNETTAFVAGVLDVVGPRPADAAWPSFAADLRAGRLPLRLQLTTAIRFRLDGGGGGGGGGGFGFESGRQTMHVDCHVVVGADGELLPEFVGAACDRYF